MTQKYAKVQAEILNAYDTAQTTGKLTTVTISGTVLQAAPWYGITPFYTEAHGYLTFWEACNLLSNRTI
jgi:hypothetical protein